MMIGEREYNRLLKTAYDVTILRMKVSVLSFISESVSLVKLPPTPEHDE